MVILLPQIARRCHREGDYVCYRYFSNRISCDGIGWVKPGDSVVIYGAGPVGLMAAHSASIKGASKIMVVDNHPDR
jgi:NADPH-dependent 2,4-dienoyl-CoA reductase/sulfur reductase-like enzyme